MDGCPWCSFALFFFYSLSISVPGVVVVVGVACFVFSVFWNHLLEEQYILAWLVRFP